LFHPKTFFVLSLQFIVIAELGADYNFFRLSENNC